MAKKQSDNEELKQAWEATKRAAAAGWRWFRRLPPKVQAGAWIALILLIIIANVSSPEEDSGSDADKTGGQEQVADGQQSESDSDSEPKPKPFRATDAQVVAFFEEEMDDPPDWADGERVRGTSCNRVTCLVRYNANDAVFNPEKETLQDTRPLFKMLFSDRRLKTAKLIPHAETTTVGGKTDVSPVMRITCDREAHEQIDWDAVDADGIKTLCDYVPLVNFD